MSAAKRISSSQGRGIFRGVTSFILLILSALIIIGVVIIFQARSLILDIVTPLPRDQSLSTHIPCAPPCWYGLRVGGSSFEDVENFVLQNSRIPSWSATFLDDDHYIGWIRPIRNERGSFWFDERDVLKHFRLTLADGISLPSLIELYGEPNVTRVYFDQIIDAPLRRQGLVGVDLYYPNIGLIIHSSFDYESEYGEVNFSVPENPTAKEFTFYAPSNNFNDFLLQVFPGYTGDVEQTILQRGDHILGWPGFSVNIRPSVSGSFPIIEVPGE